MAAGELATPPNALAGFASAASSILPLIFGSGKTTSKTTSDPNAIAGLQGIANTATANSTDDSITTNLVNNIMRQAAIQFAPIVAQSKTAGLYNSSTLTQLASNAQSDATADASGAVLNYKTNQQQIAANAFGTIANNSRTTTQQTAPSIPPGISTALSAAAVAKSAFSNRDAISSFIKDPSGSIKKLFDFGSDSTSEVGNQTFAGSPFEGASGFGSPTPFTPESFITSSGADAASDPALASLDAASSTINNGFGGSNTPDGATLAADGTSQLGLTPADTSLLAPTIANEATTGTAGLTGTSQVPGAINTGAGFESTPGLVQPGLTDAASSAGIDTLASDSPDIIDTASSIDDAADLTSGFADAGADEAAADIGTDIGTEAVSSAILDYAQPVGWAHLGLNLIDPNENIPLHEQFNDILSPAYEAVGGVVDAGIGAVEDIGSGIGDAVSIVCTEAVRQGLMDVTLYRNEARANALRLSKLTLTGYHLIAIPFVYAMRNDKWWAKFLAGWATKYCEYTLGIKWSICGFLLRHFGEKLCWIVGLAAAAIGDKPDLVALYEGVK